MKAAPPATTRATCANAELSTGRWLSYRDLLKLVDPATATDLAIASVVVMLFVHHSCIYIVVRTTGRSSSPSTDPERAIVSREAARGHATWTPRIRSLCARSSSMISTQENIDTWVAEVGVAGGGSPTCRVRECVARTRRASRSTSCRIGTVAQARCRTPRSRAEFSLTVDRLRDMVAEIPGAKIAVEPQQMGPPVGKPINVEISGEDYDQVGELALTLRRGIERAVDGVADLEDDYGVGRPELRLRIDRGAAKRVGVSTAQVGDTVRTAVAGSVATTIMDGEEEIDVVVALAPEYRENLQQVLTLKLPGREDTSPDTYSVPLSAVATYEFVGGSSGINHVDQDMVVTISGDVAEGFNENAVRAEVQAFLDGQELPSGIATALTGANQEQDDAAVFLVRAFLIAVALILLVLVTQFDSIALPAIIVATVVLSMIGVLWGLMLTGTPFGVIMTGLGVISLAGVVVNNAIVLLDYVQQLIERGVSTEDALVEAGLTRFRPVVLTAITTALGLVPMAVGVSFDFTRFKVLVGGTSAQWWGPMAVAVIFGLVFATLLTLVMVPTLYSINEDLRGLGERVRMRGTQAAATGVALLLVAAGLLWPFPASALTLEEAWRAAEDNDLTLALAREDAVQVSTLRGQAWSTTLPRITGSVGYVINNQSIEFPTDVFAPIRQVGPAINGLYELNGLDPALPTEPCTGGETIEDGCLPDPLSLVVQEQTFLQADLQLNQRLFSAPALPALQATYKLHRAAQEDLRGAGQQSRATVAQAFYGLLAAERAVTVSEDALKIAEAQKELAARQVGAGLADRRATLQAELGVSQAERDLQSAREGLLDAQTAFELITGIEGQDLVLPEPFPIPEGVDSAMKTARTARPDLQAADYRVSATRLERLAQDLRWLPTVDLAGSLNWTENTGFNDQNLTWRVVLQGSWEFFAGGIRMAERRNAASRARAAGLAKELTERQVERDVRLAFEAHRRAEEALQAVDNELSLATESLELAERSYAAGSATWLEVEQARLQLASTQLGQLRERTTRDLAAIDLLLRTGTL